MKKLFFSLALVLMGLNAAVAQSNLVATLSHEGNVSLFYGYNAFVDAMAAADHGDVITLSSGLFAPADITKAVTIRGAAMADDVEKGILKTKINSERTKYEIYINIPDETNGHTLTIEFIDFGDLYIYNFSHLQDPKFQHVNLNLFYPDHSGWMKNALLVNININDFQSYSSESSFTFICCIFSDYFRYYSNTSQCNVLNSVVRFNNSDELIYNVKYIYFKNCIFPNPPGVLDGTNTCDHCLAVVENGNADILANMIGTNWTVNSSSEIFTGEDNYVLTTTAAQTYVGTDGSQVGIWGGVMPWQTTAENPTITKCNVANRSTADGKLSVEIEVSGVQ